MRIIGILLSCLLLTYVNVSAQVSNPVPELTIALDISADALVFSPDGARLAVGGRDNIIRVIDAHTGEELMQSEGHTDAINSLIFSADGQLLISGSDDDSVRVFDAYSGELLQVVASHDNDVLSVAMNVDGSHIASAGRDNMLYVRDVASGEITATFATLEPAYQVRFGAADDYLIAAHEDGTITVLRRQAEIQLWYEFSTDAGTITALEVTEDDRIITGNVDNSLQLWAIGDGASTLHQTFEGHIAPVTDAYLDQSGQFIVSASIDSTIRFWDVATGQQRGLVQEHDAPITAMANHRNQYATISTDGVLNLWLISSDGIVNMGNTDNATFNLPFLRPPDTVETSQLYIPTANIASPLTTFPLGGNTWVIDPNEPLVGHFEGTAWLNHTGNVVMGGHSEYPDGRAGIFNSLYDVGMGDEIYVQADDILKRYIVTNIMAVDYRDIRVVMPTTHNQLTLITCDIPSYVIDQNLYYERWVVIAEELP